MIFDPIALEYSTFLKFSASVPLRFGAMLTEARGRWMATYDRDWRSLSLGLHYVKERTSEALSQLGSIHATGVKFQQGSQTLTERDLEMQLTDRFIYAAYEEWQAGLIQTNRINELIFTGQDALSALPKQVIYATMHVDSPMLGLVQLGRWGIPLCALSSNVVEDPRVHPAITRFFVSKYLHMATHWHGGRCMHKESEMGAFVRAAKEGFSLAVFCDVPGQMQNGKGLTVPFLGKPRLMAPVALRLAERLDLPVVGMITRRLSYKDYRIELSAPCYPTNDQSWIWPIYQFWSDKILENTPAWWASDLLADM
jgi:hypothetical protein